MLDINQFQMKQWLALLPVIVSAEPVQKIYIFTNKDLKGFENAINRDVANLISTFVNPQVLSLSQASAVFPKLRHTEAMSFHVHSQPVFASSEPNVLPSGKLFTLHVTGDDRKYFDGSISMEFTNVLGECQDMGFFKEELSKPRVFNRLPLEVTTDRLNVFELNDWDLTMALGTRVALYIPTGCTMTMDSLSRTFFLKENLDDPLAIQTTRIFPITSTKGDVLTLQETENLFPELQLGKLTDRRAIITYEARLLESDRITMPKGVYLTFPGQKVIGQPTIRMYFNVVESGSACEQVKFYRTVSDGMKEITQTLDRRIEYSWNGLAVIASDIESKSNGYHLFIPQDCRLDMTKVSRTEAKPASFNFMRLKLVTTVFNL